jgi:exosortase A-associated hydrolase 2
VTNVDARDETPFFFNLGGQQLFGILHAPAGAKPRRGWVFCHPFAEEKLWAQRVYVSFARILAARGDLVLRFDHRGHGDSDGRFEDASLTTYLEDADAALSTLQTRLPTDCPIGLLGLRLGASVAALAAEKNPRVDRLVLWEPVVDGEAHGQEILLTNLATQMATHGKVVIERAELVSRMQAGETVNIDGYEMSNTMFQQIRSLKLAAEPRLFAGSCLVVQVDRNTRPPRPALKTLVDRYHSAELNSVAEQPFWKEIREFYGKADRLYAGTLGWLERPQ